MRLTVETMPLSADRWAPARAALRAADPRMGDLIDADPTLDPDTVLDGWPTDLWDALVFNVVGQQLSVAATRAILGRLEALHDGRLPTPSELLATHAETLRRIGLSRAKTVYLPCADLTSGRPPTSRFGGRSSESGISTRPRRSPRSTR
jgi:3-methyladenine DNA glycosylase/8-oxoguanine DNA glycosylase